jgi:hypothetical protein
VSAEKPGRVIQICEDLHEQRPGFFRAFWADSKDSTEVVTVIGYASPGGSHRTIRAAAAEARRMHPGVEVFRNGRKVP